MARNPFGSPHAAGALRSRRRCAFPQLLGAAVIAAVALALPAASYGHGGGGGEVVEHFEDHIPELEHEVEDLATHVDGIVERHRAGKPVEAAMRELIEEWETVAVHEVIETRSVSLYPPIWQGIYAMKQSADNAPESGAMRRAGEQTKSAFWQALGAVRLLAEGDVTTTGGKEGGDTGERREIAPGNRIELTGNDAMRFNKTAFTVRAGEPVTLHFENIGELPKEVMGHNVVVLERGTPIKPFGLAAAKAAEHDYIPQSEEHLDSIIAHTRMLGPGGEETITFTLEEPGDYPFLCSFTAHYQLMQGTITAVAGSADTGDAPDASKEPVAAIVHRLEKALTAYADGDAERAGELVGSAYFNIFEGLEGDLIEQDPELVSDLEIDFNAALPSLFEDGAPVDEARAKLDEMRKKLKTAAQLLKRAEDARPSVF